MPPGGGKCHVGEAGKTAQDRQPLAVVRPRWMLHDTVQRYAADATVWLRRCRQAAMCNTWEKSCRALGSGVESPRGINHDRQPLAVLYNAGGDATRMARRRGEVREKTSCRHVVCV